MAVAGINMYFQSTNQDRSHSHQWGKKHCPAYHPVYLRRVIPNKQFLRFQTLLSNTASSLCFGTSWDSCFLFLLSEDQPVTHTATFELCSYSNPKFYFRQPKWSYSDTTVVSMVYDSRASWLWSGILGHDKNIYPRTKFHCESNCDAQEKYFWLFFLLHVLVICSLEHKNDFRRYPPSIPSQHFFLQRALPDARIPQILQLSTTNCVHYYRAVILLTERMMLSNQAGTVV